MAGTKLRARIRPLSRGHDEIDEVAIELSNPDGSPFQGGGGGGVSAFLDGHNMVKNVAGTNAFLYFDGTEENVDIVGFDNSDAEQSLQLPAGIYASTWQWGFDPSADDGVGDTLRRFSVELQPIGKSLEIVVPKPAGGWADVDPYLKSYGFNFVLPNPQSLIVQLDASNSGETNVQFYLNFTLYKLGDLPT